jgi:hypothetical protein
MRRAAAIAAAVLACAQSVAPAAAGQEICTRLNAYIRAPFSTAPGQAPVARSIEFYWQPPGILGAVQCVHNGVAANKALCDWLMENTSREFSEQLPDAVLTCFGFSFPPVPNVEDWRATYSFVDDKTLRRLVLDVRHGQPDIDYDAIRISVLPDGQDTSLHPLPDFPSPPKLDN